MEQYKVWFQQDHDDHGWWHHPDCQDDATAHTARLFYSAWIPKVDSVLYPSPNTSLPKERIHELINSIIEDILRRFMLNFRRRLLKFIEEDGGYLESVIFVI
ncbi:hypothetical protein NQ317_017417 [Molorchus minor]|uniref:Uncharacterized protein n=1 Tax=Molorchus minor TaxID=1323400 RepID=A0ABQ9ISY6_9CUCU|nr:hypothetical protein NQ317_017417 [Molorchus minor]